MKIMHNGGIRSFLLPGDGCCGSASVMKAVPYYFVPGVYFCLCGCHAEVRSNLFPGTLDPCCRQDDSAS